MAATDALLSVVFRRLATIARTRPELITPELVIETSTRLRNLDLFGGECPEECAEPRDRAEELICALLCGQS